MSKGGRRLDKLTDTAVTITATYHKGLGGQVPKNGVIEIEKR